MCIRDRLYLDEIQYFNKKQQQSLLEFKMCIRDRVRIAKIKIKKE